MGLTVPVPSSMEFNSIGSMYAQDGAKTSIDLNNVDVLVISLRISGHNQPVFVPLKMIAEGTNYYSIVINEGANTATTTVQIDKSDSSYTVTARLWYSNYWNVNQATIQFYTIRIP